MGIHDFYIIFEIKFHKYDGYEKFRKNFGTLSDLIENGILTSKDIKDEISTDLKFKRDKIINKLDLVSKEEFEVLKKIVQKQDLIIKKILKSKKTKKAKNLNL